MREYRERHPRAEGEEGREEDSRGGEGAFEEPDLLGVSREVTVPVDEVAARLDELLDEVEQGAHVVIVRDGKRLAMMMSWPAYVDLREKLADMASASWSAWRSGVFDVGGYATEVTRIRHRRPGAKSTPTSGDDEVRASEEGDGDERVR